MLDIKGAAKFLAVSETSLRRWTNAGELACFRVGGRGDRRFRRADLLAFAAGHSPTPLAEGDGPPNGALREPIGAAGPSISDRHICAFYSSDDERAKQASDFLINGMRPDSVCYLSAAPETRERVLTEVARQHPAFQADVDAGRLVVSTYATSIAAQLEHWENAFSRATRAGARLLRVVGDVTGARFADVGTFGDALTYEAEYERRLVTRFPVQTLCQYDVRPLAGVDVLRVLRAHHHVSATPALSLSCRGHPHRPSLVMSGLPEG
ncbi:MAG: MEDS domain-containing protein [Gemmatimonadaceae bacterium]